LKPSAIINVLGLVGSVKEIEDAIEYEKEEEQAEGEGVR